MMTTDNPDRHHPTTADDVASSPTRRSVLGALLSGAALLSSAHEIGRASCRERV